MKSACAARYPRSPGAEDELSWNLSAFRTLLHDDIFGIATSVSQGFFQNIGDTRRQGFEAGLALPGPALLGLRKLQLRAGDVRILAAWCHPRPTLFRTRTEISRSIPGTAYPAFPSIASKIGTDYRIIAPWSIGATVNVVSSVYYVGDESNQLAPIPGYTTVNLHSIYRPTRHLELFASVNNLFNKKYATWGILSDPTGIGAPGIPPGGVTNGPGVDNRFLSPAAPLEAFVGLRLSL